MCGLAVTLLSPAERSQEELERIWGIFTENLVQNEERGKEASGVGIVGMDGTRRVWKLPCRASEFVLTDDFRKYARQAFTKSVVCLLGHARKPTKGETNQSLNNHPITTKNLIGIHNGEVSNDDSLFASFVMPRKGLVDSEAIFALLEGIPPGIKGQAYRRAIATRINLVQGKLTSVSMDIRRPGELLVLKRDMPLSMHYEDSMQALFFSSKYIFLRKAFGRSVVTEALESGQGYIFKVNEFINIPYRYSETFFLNNRT